MIVGYCSIGRARIATSPASTMMIETTAAKTGRSMKKRENTRFSPDGERDVDAPRLLGFGAADDVCRRAQADAISLHSGGDQRVAHGLRTLFGEHAVLGGRALCIHVARDLDRVWSADQSIADRAQRLLRIRVEHGRAAGEVHAG